MTHEHYMHRALALARKGRGWVNPNPMVGAVIVKDGEIIGQGWHDRCGGPHAERHALANCTADPAGATMYVTLEPCCHHGRTPPCTDAVLEAGIQTVVVGSQDPNPKVAGHGLEILREAGITVIDGVLKVECDQLNRVFFHYIQQDTPYVVMKYGMTADGKIATVTGASRWITGEQARAHTHQTRHDLSAIMVGIGTVLADDPLLTCRIDGGRDPLRVICDSRLRMPLDSQIVQTAGQIPTCIAYAQAAEEQIQRLTDRGIQLLHLPSPSGQVDLTALMKALHIQQIDSVLVEGGAELNYGMLAQGLVQRVQVYLAPKIFGGGAKTPVGGAGVNLPSQAFGLGTPEVTAIGDDLLLEYDVVGGGQTNVYRNC